MTHGHRDFTVCSCSLLPVLLPGGHSSVSAALKCSTTAVTSGEPVMRSARANARRRIAASRHCGSGCNQAPRPGSFLAGSTVTACSPFPSTARLLEAVRRPALASGSRRTSAPVRPWGRWHFCASEPKSRAGSRLSLPSACLRTETAVLVAGQADAPAGITGRAPLRVPLQDPARTRLRRRVAANVDPPAGQPGGQAGVLALLADRQGQLEIGDYHAGGAR